MKRDAKRDNVTLPNVTGVTLSKSDVLLSDSLTSMEWVLPREIYAIRHGNASRCRSQLVSGLTFFSETAF